ncbi:MAG: hypothetical protein NTU54_05825 [Candidatus Omnitrophica bacterium]|nr:hypothetical protein [Candidatus Omnitrophota bacterium]
MEDKLTKERVVTFLNRGEVDFLDKLGKDALFSSGLKLSRAKLIEWLVDLIKELNIDGANLKTEEDLKNRVIKSLPPATPACRNAEK